jgi:hypothetical protein
MWLNINWRNLQHLTVTGSFELYTFFLYLGSWRLQVCPRVSYYLPCYMGHICGLHCYDHLGRICAVLSVQKKAVDNFPVEQGPWKADICSCSQDIPSFNEKWTFISELKSACHWGPLWHCTFFYDRLSAIHPTGANITVVETANFHFI